MRRFLHAGTAVLAVVACNGDKTSETDDTDLTDAGPPSFEFVSSVRAKSFEAEIAQSTVEAHQVATMLMSSVGVVVADQKVQDRLSTDGRAEAQRSAASPPTASAYGGTGGDCWARPEFPMFSFTIDYTGCSAYQMGGGVFVVDHPSGPVLFNFFDFFIGNRQLGGSFALDTRGAYPDDLYWQTYNTDGQNPGPENRVPIGVTLDRTAVGAQITGGARINFFEDAWAMWGVLETGPVEDPVTVVLGGVTPEDVEPDEPPAATDVMKSSLNWLSCRCPTSGKSTYDMPLHFSQVTIDIDDLEVEPDDVDDPDLVIPLEEDVEGLGILTHTGCGTYDVEYQSDDAQIVLPIDRLIGAVSFQCDTLAIPDRERCNALVDAARNLGEELVIEVPKADANRTATEAVEAEFDTTFCRLY